MSNNLRQAAQQALEALEGVAQWVEKRPDTHPWDAWQRIDPAIYALRQALAEPQREHITDGSPCWCNPDVIEEEGGNVIVHNYEDNWQQYAKPGETAQQCIERHRGEQDALMKLYATPRRPLTDEQCDSILLALDEWAKRFDHYDYGLPLYNEELRAKAREVMRIAHGITGEQK